MNQLKQTIIALPQFDQLRSALNRKKQVHLGGVIGSFRAFVCAFVTEKLNRPLLYIANNADSAERLRDDLELLTAAQPLTFLPATEFEPYDANDANPSLISLRLETMETYLSADLWISVATAEGLMQSFPLPESFVDNQLYIKVGQRLNFDSLLQGLQKLGLKREEMVEQVGEFSVRGGIVDLFVWNVNDPLRIEFFGDEVESIRRFDVFSQRSVEALNEIILLPNLFNTQKENVFINSLLPQNVVLFIEDTEIVSKHIEHVYSKAQTVFKENLKAGIVEETPEARYFTPQEFTRFIQKNSLIETGLIKSSAFEKIRFTVQPHPEFNGSAKLFLDYLKKQDSSQHLLIQCSNQAQKDRLQEIMDDEQMTFSGKMTLGTLHNGFLLPDLNLQILTEHEIFNRFKRRHTYKHFKSGEYLRQLSSLNLYDYVVHIDYGIGRYMGMEMLDLGGAKKECIKIAYRDGDNLFVTVDRLNRVQKYSSEEAGKPHLTKLGTSEWERAKLKTKEAIKKVAEELISIYAGRKAQPGYHFSADSKWQRELEASFVFEETQDQLKSIDEVKRDMEDDRPMDRLLCGDVGFGKTEVALRAAFKAIMDGKQVVLLVPTTILAFQHYETFKARLRDFPLNLEMLNRFRTPKEQKHIITDLLEGKLDLVIGTHRLLSDDVKFKDLGLLIIDEEQRFGVKQKEKLKKYRLSVDVLSMTATPIPRTLHMALMGARDLSNIDTPPSNRLPIHTEMIHWDDANLRNIIMKEIKRGGQVYFVHNRVETIMAVKEILAQIVPKARVAVGHGQLPERRLEKVMLDFMHNKFDVLLATMIIENGLDIPNVNTIIINRADKFGLSQLYQLRGRVGRSDEQAYAYLLVPRQDKMTSTAIKRLRAIQDFTELGSGYKVALRDLEIRGAGNLLGKEQSGFVQTVGFDMYCRILDEAVKELKTGAERAHLPELTTPEADIRLDADFDLLIPENYISSNLERISVYHRLVNLSDATQVESLKEELRDRFGKLPAEVIRFLKVIELKIIAAGIYARRLVIKKHSLKIFFSEQAQYDDRFFNYSIPALLNQKSARVRFLNQSDLAVQITLPGEDWLQKLDFAKKLLQAVIKYD